MNAQEPVNDGAKLEGIVTFTVVGADGKVKEKVTVKNAVVKVGRTALMDRLTNASPDQDCLINYIAVGDSVTAVADGNTQLGNETAREAIASRTHAFDVGAISTVFAAGDIPAGTLKEAGLFMDATGTADSGTLLSRVAVNIVITALDSLFIDWRLTLSNAA